jgi:hypothetical protein
MRNVVERKGLDCDLTLEAAVLGAVDFPHPAGAQSLKNLVTAKARTRRQGG